MDYITLPNCNVCSKVFETMEAFTKHVKYSEVHRLNLIPKVKVEPPPAIPALSLPLPDAASNTFMSSAPSLPAPPLTMREQLTALQMQSSALLPEDTTALYHSVADELAAVRTSRMEAAKHLESLNTAKH